MKKLIKKIGMFFYKVTGLQAIVSAIESAILRYRLRVRMVPVSFKVFIWSLGLVTGVTGMYTVENKDLLTPQVRVYENKVIPVVEAKEIEAAPVDRVKELSDLIYSRESSNGKNNFTKCEAIGKINGIGYAIPGDGSYVCFNSHDEEMEVLRGWIIAKQAAGWSEYKMLCTYSGNNYKECKK